MSDQEVTGDPLRPDSAGCLPFLLRTMWMGWGTLALFLCAAKVAEGTASPVSEILFFLVAGGLIGVRYVDITRFRGQTVDGKPADLSHWRRYTAGVLLLSTLLWGLADLLASIGWM